MLEDELDEAGLLLDTDDLPEDIAELLTLLESDDLIDEDDFEEDKGLLDDDDLISDDCADDEGFEDDTGLLELTALTGIISIQFRFHPPVSA